jgi:hypothetical protein
MLAPFYSLLFGIITVLGATLAIYRWRHHQTRALAFGWLALSVAVWLLFYALKPTSTSLVENLLAFIILVWPLLGFGLIHIAPLTNPALLKGICGGVIVLDARNRVADFNSEAEQIARQYSAMPSRQPVQQFLASHPDLLGMCQGHNRSRMEIRLGEQAAQRYYDAQLTPIFNWRGKLCGRLLVLYEITDAKRAQASQDIYGRG